MAARRQLRFLVIALAMVALLTAVWAELLRLGRHVPILFVTLPCYHGP
jgi:hypothetical protein